MPCHVVVILEYFDGPADHKGGEGAGHIELLDSAAAGVLVLGHGDDQGLFGVAEADPGALGLYQRLFVGGGKFRQQFRVVYVEELVVGFGGAGGGFDHADGGVVDFHFEGCGGIDAEGVEGECDCFGGGFPVVFVFTGDG